MIGFPSQGELIKFVFDAAGLLATKRNELEGLDETTKKSIQTALRRLASEDGSLSERFAEMTELLNGALIGSIPQPKVILASGDVLFDLFGVYNAVIRDDGTYLGKTETIRWIISRYLVPRLALSVNKHLLAYNVAADKLITPQDSQWFLPSIDGESITWPLKKVMRWAYDLCGCSHTHFHHPDKNTEVAEAQLQQNLDNAANWLADKGLPSLGALLWNFDRSFESLRSCKNPKHRRDIPDLAKRSIRVALLIARISTYVCKELQRHLGATFLAETIEQYRRHSAWIAADTTVIQRSVAEYLAQNDVPPEELDRLWRVVSDHFWRRLAENEVHSGHLLHRLFEQSANGMLPEEEIQRLTEQYGKFLVLAEMEAWERQRQMTPPEAFQGQLLAGFDLKKCPTTTHEEIDQYAEMLKANGVEDLLPWMVPWLRGVLLYRSENFEAAFSHFQLAFEKAKYCAGNKQYDLVNRYVELSAKTDHWREFKKGVHWAKYLGISIRLLRDDEPTDENLRPVFRMMKKITYPV